MPALVQRAVVVADVDAQHAVLATAVDLDTVVADVLADAVPDRVLHDRLQHQAGHGRVQHVGRDMDARGQAVTEASPLDAQVQLQQFQFAAQRDFLAVVVLQERAQQFAQAQQHVFRRQRVLVQQGDDGVQRVEQEMRLQLRLQHLQARLRQFGGQSGRLQFAPCLLGLEVQQLLHGEQGPVRQQAGGEVLADELPQLLAETGGLEQRRHQGADRHRQQGDADAVADVPQ